MLNFPIVRIFYVQSQYSVNRNPFQYDVSIPSRHLHNHLPSNSSQKSVPLRTRCPCNHQIRLVVLRSLHARIRSANISVKSVFCATSSATNASIASELYTDRTVWGRIFKVPTPGMVCAVMPTSCMRSVRASLTSCCFASSALTSLASSR